MGYIGPSSFYQITLAQRIRGNQGRKQLVGISQLSGPVEHNFSAGFSSARCAKVSRWLFSAKFACPETRNFQTTATVHNMSAADQLTEN